jgi:hypothetical protein
MSKKQNHQKCDKNRKYISNKRTPYLENRGEPGVSMMQYQFQVPDGFLKVNLLTRIHSNNRREDAQ